MSLKINKEKFYIKKSEDLQVAFDKINLSNNTSILVPSLTGTKDENGNLKPIRAPWINKRVGDKRKTQLDYAKDGIVTKEMEYVAIRESYKCDDTMAFDESMVLNEVKIGRAVIPANINHIQLEPTIIGKKFSVKINANIGVSSEGSNLDKELEKLDLSLNYGADTIMDLSTGVKNLDTIRKSIISSSPVPIGTVPIYETLDRAGGDINQVNWKLFKEVIIDQAKQGVDYFTIHAGLLQKELAHSSKRCMGIVSRGGSIMANLMMNTDEENIAYSNFDELLDICKEYDVSLSLGDGLRPGALMDACDEAQYGELKNIGALAKRCYQAGVQCFIEGPGHVPLHKIPENQELEDKYCNEAPFYTLGPLVTDIAPGYDHITSAIGAANIAALGTAMLCYVTPSEHLALPNANDVKVGIITYKIAAHAADIAKGLPGAMIRDNALSQARAEFRWYDQFALSLDPTHAYEVWASQMPEDCAHEPSFCSMCGPRFCPIRLNKKIKVKFNAK